MAVVGIVAIVGVLAVGLAGHAQVSRTVRRAEDGSGEKKLQRREGDLLRLDGEFAVTGDRITFYPEGSDEIIRTLENLALERIGKMLEETRGEGLWTVEGTVTEFRGQNFLLVTRAVLKAKESFDPRRGF